MTSLLITICLTLAVLLGSAGVSWAADYQTGLTAYRSGDYATALREWTPLAEQGTANAQYNLGVMYAQGSGVLQDIGGAHMWLNIAAANGLSAAVGERDRLAKKLSGEQLEKANERAKRCMDSDYKDCDAKAKSWWQKLKD
jgi:TPR repeat protein